MKRITTLLLSLAILLSIISLSLAEGEQPTISPEELYDMMIGDFERADYESALNKAEAIFTMDDNYKDVPLYLLYLEGMASLNADRFDEAIKAFSTAASFNFQDAEGYTLYAEGRKYEYNHDFENARLKYSAASEKNIMKAAMALYKLPDSGKKTIELKDEKIGTENIELKWQDDLEKSSYIVTWYRSGMEKTLEQYRTETKEAMLQNLLPATEYIVTVTAEGKEFYTVTKAYLTEQAKVGNPLGISSFQITMDSQPVPYRCILGSLSPMEIGTNYYIRINFSIKMPDADADTEMLCVLRLDGKTEAVRTNVLCETKKTWLTVEFDLNNCIDQFCQNDASFIGKTVSMDLYINGVYFCQQDLVLFVDEEENKE